MTYILFLARHTKRATTSFFGWRSSMSFDMAHVFFSGRKHSMLWLSGFGYIVIGMTWMITGLVTPIDPAFDWLKLYIGSWGEPENLAWIWVIAGCIQMLPAILPTVRRTTIDRPMAFGFGAAILAPSLWAAIYMLSGSHGYVYGPRHGVVFLIMAVIAWEVSGWEEPSAAVRVHGIINAIKEETDDD